MLDMHVRFRQNRGIALGRIFRQPGNGSTVGNGSPVLYGTVEPDPSESSAFSQYPYAPRSCRRGTVVYPLNIEFRGQTNGFNGFQNLRLAFEIRKVSNPSQATALYCTYECSRCSPSFWHSRYHLFFSPATVRDTGMILLLQMLHPEKTPLVWHSRG